MNEQCLACMKVKEYNHKHPSDKIIIFLAQLFLTLASLGIYACIFYKNIHEPLASISTK